MKDEKTDWGGKVRDLRRRLNLSQDDLASKLHTNQCTISRWERGITSPNYRMRAKLELLGCSPAEPEKTETEVIAETAQVLFDCSSQPSLLLHHDGTIMAVSSDNEYQPGLKYQTGVKLKEQTLPEDMETLLELESFFDEVDFWNTENESFTFPYLSRGEPRCVSLTSVLINSQVYCLMQKVSV